MVYSAGSLHTGTGVAFIMAVEINTLRVQYRRLYDSTNMDTITAMSVSPDGSTIACHGSKYNGGLWSR